MVDPPRDAFTPHLTPHHPDRRNNQFALVGPPGQSEDVDGARIPKVADSANHHGNPCYHPDVNQDQRGLHMSTVGTDLTTQLKPQDISADFQQAVEESRGAASKSAGWTARLSWNNGDLESFKPVGSSPISEIESDRGDCAVGLQIPRMSSGARAIFERCRCSSAIVDIGDR